MNTGASQFERRWWILAVIGLAQLMVVLDATIVNIALPSAQRALHFSNDSRQWIVTAYALAFGSLLLAGRADRRPVRSQADVHRRAGRVLGRVRRSVAPRDSSRCLSGLGRPGRVRRDPRAVGAGAADDHVRRPGRARQGVCGLRRDRRRRRRDRLLARRRADPGVSWRLTLFVNLAIALPAALAALWLLVNERQRRAPSAGSARHRDRVAGPVRARLRLLQRRDALVV